MDFNEYQGLTAEGSSVAKPLAKIMRTYGPLSQRGLEGLFILARGFILWFSIKPTMLLPTKPCTSGPAELTIPR